RLLAAAIALCRGDLADSRALIATARTALGRVGFLYSDTQFYLPLAQLEAEQCLAEGRQADALDVVTAAVDRFDLLRDPRYAWPLPTPAARVCATLPAAALRDRGTAERAGVLLGSFARWPRRWTSPDSSGRPDGSPSLPRPAPARQTPQPPRKPWRAALQPRLMHCPAPLSWRRPTGGPPPPRPRPPPPPPPPAAPPPRRPPC